jgi:hypothetical protein
VGAFSLIISDVADEAAFRAMQAKRLTCR